VVVVGVCAVIEADSERTISGEDNDSTVDPPHLFQESWVSTNSEEHAMILDEKEGQIHTR